MALEEIRVLVVDDSAVIRSLIADSIAATPGMKVVGTAEDGQKARTPNRLPHARPGIVDSTGPRGPQGSPWDSLVLLISQLRRHVGRAENGGHGL